LFNNSNINEDIATKFEQEYVRCVRNEKECVEIKCQLDATEVFIADLIVCSTCFGAPLCPSAEGYVSGLQDAAASCKPDT